VVADLGEGGDGAPARLELARPRHPVAAALHLHQVAHHLSAGLVVVEVHEGAEPPLLLPSLALGGVHELPRELVAEAKVVAAAAPLPALGGAEALPAHVAVAVGEVARGAGLRDRVHHPRRGHRVDEGRLPAPSLDDGAEGHLRVAVGCGAVPALVPELPLALRDAAPRARRHRADRVGVRLAHRHLLLHKSREVLADADGGGGGDIPPGGLLVPLGKQGGHPHHPEVHPAGSRCHHRGCHPCHHRHSCHLPPQWHRHATEFVLHRQVTSVNLRCSHFLPVT